MNIKAFFITTIILTSQIASAQWAYQKQGGAFDDRPKHVIATSYNGYSFGFICKDIQSIQAVYVTTELIGNTSIDNLNSVYPELLIRVDDGEILELDTKFKDTGEYIGVISTVSKKELEQVINAKSKISVAIRVLLDPAHENKFSAEGSTSNGTKFIAQCEMQ